MNGESKHTAEEELCADISKEPESNKPTLTRNYRYYFTAAAPLGILAAIIQIFVYRLYYDADMMLYFASAPLASLLNVFLLLCAVLAATALFTSKNAALPERRIGTVTEIPALFSAFIMIICALLGVIGILRGYDVLDVNSEPFRYLLPISAALGSAYFLTQSFLHAESDEEKQKNISTVAFFGIFLLIYLVVELLNLYYDRSSPINEPSKLLRMLSLMASMLYILYEVKLSLDPQKTGAYIFCTAIALIFVPLSCISMLVSLLTGFFPLTASAAVSCALDLGIYAYILMRTLTSLVSNKS